MRTIQAGCRFCALIAVLSIPVGELRADDTVFPSDFVETPTQLAQDSLLEGASARTVTAATLNSGGAVTPSGAFTYSIPIDLPPGAHGFQPHLSLAYDSQSKNGIAGVGWALTGLPVIQRADAGDGVKYVADHDTFVFNPNGWGTPLDPRKKLVRLPSTAPGVEAGAYHTVEETWANYVPVGTCGVGPCGWRMTDGHGVTYFFGSDTPDPDENTGRHQLWEQNNGFVKHRGISAWLLAKVIDRYGNYYTVDWMISYPESSTPYESAYPAAIHYTLNDAVPAAVDIQRTVQFAYELRTDTTPMPYFFRYRLTAIGVSVAGQIANAYALTYEPSAAGAFYQRRSRLASVQRLGSDLKPATGLPPLTFSYLNGTNLHDGNSANRRSPEQQIYNNFVEHAHVYDHQPALLGDVDNDGHADLVMAHVNRHGAYVQVAQGTDGGLAPTLQHTNIDAPPGDAYDFDDGYPALLDINGDGFQDLVIIGVGSSRVSVLSALGGPKGLGALGPSVMLRDTNFVPIDSCRLPLDVVPLDFNGDQAADLAIICYQPSINNVRIAVLQGSHSGLFIQETRLSDSGDDLSASDLRVRAIAGDFNGDGKSDFVISYGHANPGFSTSPQPPAKVKLFTGTPTGFSRVGAYTAVPPPTCPSTTCWFSAYAGDYPVAGDFNGDGKTDLIYPSGQHLLGTDDVLQPFYISPDPMYIAGGPWSRAAVRDTNGDGIADIVGQSQFTSLGRPDGAFDSIGGFTSVSTPQCPSGPYRSWAPPFLYTNQQFNFPLVDLDGDGRADVLCVDGNSEDFPQGDYNLEDYAGNHYDFGKMALYYALGGGSYPQDVEFAGGTAMPHPSCPRHGHVVEDPISDQYSDCDYFQVVAGDITGDGLDDVVLLTSRGQGQTGIIGIIPSEHEQPDLLTTINNGFGGITSVTYTAAPQKKNAVASTFPRASDGNRDSSRRPLVSSLTRFDGRSLYHTDEYEYAQGTYLVGSILDDTSLGFASISRTNKETGISEQTEFFEVADFKRLPRTRTIKSSAGNTISHEVFSYVRIPANAYLTAAEHSVASNSYAVLSDYSKEEFVQGVADRTATDHYDYDHFGNATGHTHCDNSLCRYDYAYYTNDTSQWLLSRVDWREAYDAPAGSGSQHVLEKRQYAYVNGYDLQTEQRLECIDADDCFCTPGPNANCTSQHSPLKWATIRSGITYDAMGNIQSSYDATGHSFLSYDPASPSPYSVMRYWKAGRLNAHAGYEYDHDNLGRLTYRNTGTADTFSYDNNGRIARIDHSNGGTDWFVFLHWGNPTGPRSTAQAVVQLNTPTGQSKAALPAKEKTQFFDGFGQIYEELQNGDNGAIVRRRREEGYVNGHHFVVYGRPTFDAQGPADVDQFRVLYDEEGHPSEIDKLSAGQLESILESYVYHGNQTILTDANGNGTTTVVDERHRVASRSDSVGTTTFHYDNADYLRVVDKADLKTHIILGYDSLGRRRSLTDPDLGTFTYDYDDNGNLVSRTDVNRDLATSFGYDGFNRPLSRVSPDETVQFGWNSCGLASVADNSGSATMTFDGGCHVQTKAVTIAGYPQKLGVSYSYDWLNRLIQKTLPDSTSIVYKYGDTATTFSGNLSEVWVNGKWFATFSNYDAAGRAKTRQTSAATTSFSYNAFEMSTEIDSVGAGGNELQALTIAPDYVGNVRSLTDHRVNTIVGGIDTSVTQGFRYDGVNRLRVSDGLYGHMEFDYDPVGNIKQKGDIAISYPTGQIVGMRDTTPAFTGTYDYSGHLVTKTDSQGEWEQTFDAGDHLTQIRLNNVVRADFIYDHAGIRRRKTYHAPSGEAVDTYYLDGWESRISSLSPSIQSTTVHIDAPGLGVLASVTTGAIPGQPTESVVSGDVGKPFSGDVSHGPAIGTYYYLTDHLGSTSVVTNSAGVELSRIVNLPYGEVDKAHSVGFDAVSHKFVGNELDSESGLMYYGARYYDPIEARFVSADTEVPAAGTTSQGYSRYSYTLDNPLKYRDPSGHLPVLAIIAIGAVGGAALEFGRELLTQTPVSARDVSAAALGGGVTMAMALVTGGGSIYTQVIGTGIAVAEGNAVRSAVSGRSYGWDNAANDVALGADVTLAFGVLGSVTYSAFSMMDGATGNGGTSAVEPLPTNAISPQDAIRNDGTGLSPGDAVRIQNAANRTGQTITVVGSRASGTANATSDYDYVLSGNSAQRHSAASSLPRGSGGGAINALNGETGIDIFQDYNPDAFGYNPVDPLRPYVQFTPTTGGE